MERRINGNFASEQRPRGVSRAGKPFVSGWVFGDAICKIKIFASGIGQRIGITSRTYYNIVARARVTIVRNSAKIIKQKTIMVIIVV